MTQPQREPIMSIRLIALTLCVAAPFSSGQGVPAGRILYAPFDGSFDAAQARGSMTGRPHGKPEFAPGYVSLGETEAKRQNNEAAIVAYEKAIEIRAPEPYGMAHYKLARVYWAQDEPEAAIEAYQQAIANPGFRYADKARANIASLEEYIAKKKRAKRSY